MTKTSKPLGLIALVICSYFVLFHQSIHAEPIVLNIQGADIEADDLTSGAWNPVDNQNNSVISFSCGGAHAGAACARSVTEGNSEIGYVATELEQYLNLAELNIADKIDAFQMAVSFSAFGRSRGDIAQLWVEFLDADGSALARSEPVRVKANVGDPEDNVWQPLVLNEVRLPPYTRELRLVIGVLRQSGVHTDASVDGLVGGYLTELEPIPGGNIPLSIAGASIDTDAISSGNWSLVDNGNNALLRFYLSDGRIVGQAYTPEGEVAEDGFVPAEIEQTIDLEPYGYNDAIDNGNVMVSLSAWGRANGDDAWLWFQFLDANGDALGQVEPVVVEGTDKIWTEMGLYNKRLPAGTRQIRLIVGVVRHAGVHTDALFSGEVSGFLHLAEHIPLLIRGSDIGSDALASGNWTLVNNSNASKFYFPDTGVSPGSVAARAVYDSNNPESGYIVTEMEQTIDISTYAADVDGDLITASFTAWGLSVTKGDFPQIWIEYLSEEDELLAQIEPRSVREGANSWAQMGLYDIPVPPGTRKIRLIVGVTRSGGVHTDAAIDGDVEGYLTKYHVDQVGRAQPDLDLSFGSQICGLNDDEYLCFDLDGDGYIEIDELSAEEDLDPALSKYPVTFGVDAGDYDLDGIPDNIDLCPADTLDDVDGDGICGDIDNCPTASNADQADSNGDGFGDACQCGDLNNDGLLNQLDASLFSTPQYELDLTQLQKCDVDGDSFCTDMDAQVYADFLAGNISSINQYCVDNRLLIDKAMNRIGYGAPKRPSVQVQPGVRIATDSSELRRIYALGYAGYLQEQLNPILLADTDFELRRNDYARVDLGLGLPVLGVPYSDLKSQYCNESDCLDAHARIKYSMAEVKVLRASYSTRQLDAVLSDFWFNHFNVYGGFGNAIWHMPAYQEMIDDYKYDLFENLLLEVTLSPAMMSYLTLNGSSKTAPNENYAREVMELHTLGLDETYDEEQITQVARILTGWSYSTDSTPIRGTFDPDKHDMNPKEVTIAGETWLFAQENSTSCGGVSASAGENETYVLICKLSRHPKTAEFVGKKLIRRIIGDGAFEQMGSQSQLLADMIVQDLIDQWVGSNGNLQYIVDFLLTSAAPGKDASSYGSYFARSLLLDNTKAKRPFVHAVSLAKAWGSNLNVENSLVFNTASNHYSSFDGMMNSLNLQDETLFNVSPPTGYPEVSTAWVGNNLMLKKLDYIQALEDWDAANNFLPAFVQRVTLSNNGNLIQDKHYFHNYVFDNERLVKILVGMLLVGNQVDEVFVSNLVAHLNAEFNEISLGYYGSQEELIDHVKNVSALHLQDAFNQKQLEAAKAILLHPRAFYH